MRSKVLGTLRSAPLAEWNVFAASTAATGAAAWLYAAARPAAGYITDDLLTTMVLLACGWIASVGKLAASSLQAYSVAHALHIALLFVLMPYAAADPQMAPIACAAVVAGICLYEPHPSSLVLSMAVVVATSALRLVSLLTIYAWAPAAALSAQCAHLILGALVGGLGSQFGRRREELVEARKDVKRLDSTVIALTRANLQYQDFASEAEELAMEGERKRITRDIHDVVGYTLTNNIMMMEAATDMMERNPFGVPALIATARENAQEGLAQIRDSLYVLRRHEVGHATGLRALARMVRIYERATGVHVETGFGTASWQYPEDVDSAIYHLAQEALMNSFRHGKARKVTFIVAERDSEIAVTVRDDGLGSKGFEEGIGLRGMRERIGRLGGAVSVDGDRGGFVVRATIPLNRKAHGSGQDPTADR